MKEIEINSNEAGQRFDKFLGKYLDQAPKSFLYKMLRKKNITLNGKKAAGNEILALGDNVKLFFSDETIKKFSKTSKEVAPSTFSNSASEDGSSTSTVEALVSLKLIRLLRFPVSNSRSAHLSSFLVSTVQLASILLCSCLYITSKFYIHLLLYKNLQLLNSV